MKPSEDFSPREREALGLWTAHQPAPGFAERVLAEALESGLAGNAAVAPVRGARSMAAAAVVALVLGGLWSLRSIVIHPVVHPAGPPGYQPRDDQSGFIAAPDGGPRPEVNFDGIEVQSS